jgi:hypothetical protein
VTHWGRRTSVLRVFIIAAALTTSHNVGTVRRYAADVSRWAGGPTHLVIRRAYGTTIQLWLSDQDRDRPNIS